MSNEILRVSNIEKYYGKNGNITKAINNIKHEYKAKLVKLKFKWPKIGAFNPIKLETSNWLNGDKINCDICYV